jgi:hypothetical protein
MIALPGFEMKKTVSHILRSLALLLVWGLAAFTLSIAYRSYSRNRAVAQEVSRLQSDYTSQMDAYAGVLVEGDKLENDHDYRIQLLKDRFGYAEPDETPIVILDDPGQRSELEID